MFEQTFLNSFFAYCMLMYILNGKCCGLEMQTLELVLNLNEYFVPMQKFIN